MLIAARNAMMVGGKSILPPGARWVEYLENTGYTRVQYIQTNCIPTNVDIIRYTCRYLQNGNYSGILQSTYGAWNANPNYWLMDKPNSASYFHLWTFSPVQNLTFGSSKWYNVKATYEVNLKDRKVTLISGGTNSQNITVGSPNPQQPPCSIFGSAKAQCHSFSIERNGVEILNLYPIAIGNTGYMLDLVSGEYLPYGNKGTGDFVIGPDTNAPAI